MEDRKEPKGLYAPLLGLSVLFAAAAIGTLLPWPGASWENILGYRSLCTFAPIATALCALLAGATCAIRARYFGPRRGEKRSWAFPAALCVALALTIACSAPSCARAKVDARSGASELSSKP
jgi:hypothetical protein